MNIIDDFVGFTRYCSQNEGDGEKLVKGILLFYITEAEINKRLVSKQEKMELYLTWIVNYASEWGFEEEQRSVFSEMIVMLKEHIGSLSEGEAKKYLALRNMAASERNLLNGREPNIFERYLMVNEHRLPVLAEKGTVDKPVFSMETIAKVSNICNGKQWNEVSEQFLFTCLNSPQTSKLVLKRGEKDRFFCLMKVLSDKITNRETKNNWMLQVEKVYNGGRRRINKKQLKTEDSGINVDFIDSLNAL